MFKKISLIAAGLAVSVACIGASSASAAALYTTAAHTTKVPVGTKFQVKIPAGKSWKEWLPPSWESFQWQECKGGSVWFKVTQNDLAGVFKADFVESTETSTTECTYAQSTSLEGHAGEELEVKGSPTTVGTNSDWLNSSMGVSWQVKEGPFVTWLFWANVAGATGSPPTNGMFIQQPSASKAPPSIVIEKSLITHPYLAGETFSATYTFTGTAASYSFG